MKRMHPYYIIKSIRRFLPLLLFPLLRGILSLFQGNFTNWLRGTWLDIGIMAAILTLAFLRWYAVQYKVTQEGFLFHTGLLIKKKLYIPASHVVSVFVERPLLYRVLHIARLSVDSLGGENKEFDIDLILPKKTAFLIISKRQQWVGDREYETIYMPRPLYVTFLAVISSNSFTGILLLVAAGLQLLNLLETQFKTQVLHRFENLLTYFDLGFPPIVNLTAIILILGYFFAFFSHFLNNKDFTIRKGSHTLYINSGFTTLSDYSILLSEIQAVDIRQNLIAKLFHLYTVQVETAGYGKRKTKIPILIPAARYGDLLFILEDLLPHMLPANRSSIRPQRRALFAYLNLPVIALLLSPVGYLVSVMLLPSWRELFFLFYVILGAISIWMGAIRLFSFRDAGISVTDTSYTIRYSNRLTLHTVIIPVTKLVCFDLQQLPIQRVTNRCHITFFTYSERKHYHKVLGLPYHQVLSTFLGEAL